MIGKIEPADALKVALADTFAFYLKAHNFHWNVTGPSFAEYHGFFGGLYDEVQGGVDVIAEGIRTLDSFAPVSLTSLLPLATLDESGTIPDGLTMLKTLKNDNDKVLAQMLKVYDEANTSGEIGIANLLQTRIEAHEKHGWMLRSITKA